MEVTSKTLDSGFRVAVEYDCDPESPRSWDNVGTVVLIDRCRYNFGDESASYDELKAINDDPANIVLPVYMYDHSGITINTGGFSCPWDSGQVGLIYCTKEKALKEWGTGKKKIVSKKMRKKVYEFLEGEIETLDQYLRGEVYGYVLYDPEGEEVSSCWGFYGEENYCLNEGIAVARYYEEERLKKKRETWRKALREAREVRYWASRGVETVGSWA